MDNEEFKKYSDKISGLSDEQIDGEIDRIKREIKERDEIFRKIQNETNNYYLGITIDCLEGEKERREQEKGKVFIDYSRYMIVIQTAFERGKSGFNYELFKNWIEGLPGIQKVKIVEFEGEATHKDEFDDEEDDE